ncbi:hypothetical protein CY34DRAFT_233755 [Suillus luteus UH-Slu-Lm8-n1]|uniref:Uncharacterized protein n=1 Tax=Suillus luteus UH-Slu-Lm8-n1 TaxID=930992 RepID=A0A0D0BXE7_9AGAM|nr:hypothetical protein CY34DRAFT_233755 [Suillus luteus UH-Slu-Lm8-n1]
MLSPTRFLPTLIFLVCLIPQSHLDAICNDAGTKSVYEARAEGLLAYSERRSSRLEVIEPIRFHLPKPKIFMTQVCCKIMMKKHTRVYCQMLLCRFVSMSCSVLSSGPAISYMDKHGLDMVRPAQRYLSMSKLIADESILQLHRVAADL